MTDNKKCNLCYEDEEGGSIIIHCPPVGMKITREEARIIKNELESILTEDIDIK